MRNFNLTFNMEYGILYVDYNDGSNVESYPVDSVQECLDVIKDAINTTQDDPTDMRSCQPLLTMRESGCACSICGTLLHPGDKYIICPDCGGIFCEDCVQSGEFESHTCEEGEQVDA